MDTLHRIAHDQQQTRPIALRPLPKRSQNVCVNSLFVGLLQTNDEDAVMRLVAVFREILVRRDENPLVCLS